MALFINSDDKREVGINMDPKKVLIIVVAVIIALVLYDKVIKKYVD